MSTQPNKPGNPRRGQKNKVISPKVSPEAFTAYTSYTGNKSKMVSEAIVKYLNPEQ